MGATAKTRAFHDEHGRLWQARYVPDHEGLTLPDAKILEFELIADPNGARTRVPVRPGFLEEATEEQLRAALAASI
jgi:hypothetical protein